MNNKKIAFIICVNNEIYFEECCYYINRLEIPEEYEIDVIAIRDAASMCSAYNAAMENSDAKYKVYMHQDVFIRNTSFLKEIVSIFEKDNKIGVIGMMGGTQMPKTGVAYRAWNRGAVHCVDPDLAYFMFGEKGQPQEDCVVEAVDGLLIVTQYDVRWREDLFTHFDFYDVSECFEMRKAGYKILVPNQEVPWVIHDSNFAKLSFYDEGRLVALKEYKDMFYGDDGFEFVYNKEWNDLSDQIVTYIKACLDRPYGLKKWAEVKNALDEYRKGQLKNSQLEMLAVISSIYEAEKLVGAPSILDVQESFEEIYNIYQFVKFLLRRVEIFGKDKISYEELTEAIIAKNVSIEMIRLLILHSIENKEYVCKHLYDSTKMTEFKRMMEIFGKRERVITYTQKKN